MEKDMWKALSKEERDNVMRKLLDELILIEKKKHAFSKGRSQGKLGPTRFKLENQILEILSWEKEQCTNHTS